MKPNKPPTLESVEAAKRFAASLAALPEPQEKQPATAITVNDLYLACKPLTVDYYKIDHRDMLLQIVERCHQIMAIKAIKTYTIKPLDWQHHHGFYVCGKYIVAHAKNGYVVQVDENGYVRWYDCDSLEAAKAKAQELHEQELLKYLEKQ